MRALPVLVLLAGASGIARGHGAIPQASQIIVRGDQLFVPTTAWGVFLRQGNGPWQWICDEAINKDATRVWALTLDGTYHVTDYNGVTTSTDNGCTWVHATGEIATRSTAQVVADPIDPKKAWAVSYATELQAPWNGLFVTDDDGATWSALFQVDESMTGVLVSSDAQTIYAIGTPRAMPPGPPVMHLSRDGGKTFQSMPIGFTIDGNVPSAIFPEAIDPADPGTLWLVAYASPTNTLVAASNFGATYTERYRSQNDLFALDFDTANDAVLLATRTGLVRSQGGGAFVPWGDLPFAECITVTPAGIYVCSSNLPPVRTAVGLSTDAAMTFQSIFTFDQTAGPLTGCPPSTPVAQICPTSWQLYASQLGIVAAPPDFGVDLAGAPPMGGGSCSCALGRAAPPPWLAGSTLLGILWAARRRARR